MSILVTGASGFLGRAVVERLFARSVPSVRCFVRPSSSRSGLDELQLEYPGCKIEYVVGNLTSPADCRRTLHGITTIFHLAAQMRGAPASIFLNTVVASDRIIEAMLESGPRRVVLVSSLAVYGPMNGEPRQMLNESTPLECHPHKRDVYSQAKLWQETLFQKLPAKKGYEVIGLRPGIIYGQGRRKFSPRIGLEIGTRLWRFGRNNLLPLTYVQNCAEAVVTAGLKPGAVGCYNVMDNDLPTASAYLNEYRRHPVDLGPLVVDEKLVESGRSVQPFFLWTIARSPYPLSKRRAVARIGVRQLETQEPRLAATRSNGRSVAGDFRVLRTQQRR